tara:strand:- start:52 stop:813 length:762 start_codon:yes stop_codon:yes gene_type:complete
MIVIASVVLLLILILVGGLTAFYFMNKNKNKDSSSDDSSTTGGELIITEEGTETSAKSNKENYIQMPEVQKCAEANKGKKPEFCTDYKLKEDTGFAYAYDLSLGNSSGPRYEECVSGGHDCWYVEKYDEDGTMVGVVDKNGVSLLDKIADDIWNDKWDKDSGIVKEFSRIAKFEDGKLIANEKFRSRNGSDINVGDVVKPGEAPTTSLYFMVLLLSMKSAGAKKPSKITLKIKDSKKKFTDLTSEKSDSVRAP